MTDLSSSGIGIGNRASGNLALTTNATSRMTISTLGNVGIGTSLGNNGLSIMNGAKNNFSLANGW